MAMLVTIKGRGFVKVHPPETLHYLVGGNDQRLRIGDDLRIVVGRRFVWRTVRLLRSINDKTYLVDLKAREAWRFDKPKRRPKR